MTLMGRHERHPLCLRFFLSLFLLFTRKIYINHGVAVCFDVELIREKRWVLHILRRISARRQWQWHGAFVCVSTLTKWSVLWNRCVRIVWKGGKKENKSLFVNSLVATVVRMRAREKKGEFRLELMRIAFGNSISVLFSSSRSWTVICLKDWDIRAEHAYESATGCCHSIGWYSDPRCP